MTKFNSQLAPFLEKDMLEKLNEEAKKPVSLRYLANKFKITTYAVKRLLAYRQEMEESNNEKKA